MKCFTPSVSFDVFIDNYLISFRLLTHLGVNNIRATRGDKKLQKEERGHFKQRTSSKEAV